MKKRKKLLMPLLCALILATSGGELNVSAKTASNVIMENGKLENPKNGNDSDSDGGSKEDSDGGSNGDSGSSGSGSGSSSSGGDHGLDAKKLDDAISTVTQGEAVSNEAMNKAKTSLAPLGNFFKMIIALAFVLISLWIPLTFAADLLVAIIPFFDRFIGSGHGAHSGGPGGPGGNGGKGFHIQLTSNHSIRGGSGGGPGGPGGGSSGDLDFKSYFTARSKELIWTFLLIGLIVSGLYTVLLTKVVGYVTLIAVAIIDVVFDIIDGFLK